MKKGLIISIIISLACIIIDLVSKLIVMNTMYEGELITVIPYLLKFRFVYNTGAAFSSMSNSTWLLCIISLVASIAIGYFIYKYHDYKNRKLLSISLCMIFGGTFGNLIDRFLTSIGKRDGVVDFIELYIGDFNLVFGSTFNIADSFLVVGVVLLLIDMIILDNIRNKKKESLVEETKEDNDNKEVSNNE